VALSKLWLDKNNGTGEHETTLRILKLMEEAGEVARARIGMVGQNPRKGFTHDAAEVATELADCIITAAVAIESLGYRYEEVLAIAERRILTRIAGHGQQD
ncbi:MAG TPA: MazG-like family protein, partial [Pyrinomonadaceae bacterium]|nr:MazG-like family protein [Pyrinomonadaceae bacterium]